jgi:hypothetical protein
VTRKRANIIMSIQINLSVNAFKIIIINRLLPFGPESSVLPPAV